MQLKSSQPGFAATEIMLVIAVLLLLAGTGSFLYTRQHRAATNTQKTTPQTATANPGVSTTPGGVPPSANKPAAGASTIAIKIDSLGFQITVPDSLKDLTYSIASSGGVDTVAFSTHSLSAAIPACAADRGKGAFDTVIRGNGTYPGPANPSSGGLLKQYSGIYLAYNLPSAPCAKGLSTANQSLLDDQAQAFYGALASVQAIQN